jgi:hypothetical protein
MITNLWPGHNNLEVVKEPEDKGIYTETAFWHKLKKTLNYNFEYDLVKKEISKDGHMMGPCYYLRDRRWRYCFRDNLYCSRNIAKDFNEQGRVNILIEDFK